MISKKWKSSLWPIKWGAQVVVVVMLNDSGTVMVTKRSTLGTAEDSVLAHQFDDSKWTSKDAEGMDT
jgi:hypothetical protein